MRSSIASAVVLTVWASLNALVALAVVATTALTHRAPALALVLDDAAVASVDARVLGVVSAQAMLANPCIMAVCAFTVVLAWRGVRRGERWAVVTLAGVLVPLAGFAFASDAYLGSANVVANVVSTGFVAVGLVLGALGARGAPAPSTPAASAR